MVAGLAVAGLRTHALAESPVTRLAADGAIVQAEVVTTGDPVRHQQSGPAWSASVSVPAKVRVLAGRGGRWAMRIPIEVVASGDQVEAWQGMPAGSRVAVTARLAPARTGSGAAAVVRIRGPSQILARPGWGWRATNRVRAGLRDAVAHRSEDQRALVPALVLGDVSHMSPGLNAAFKATGLTHLSAVSGANLALMMAFILIAARWFGVRGWWLRALGALCVVAFVALCRTEPSVLRAAAMGVVALAGLGSTAGARTPSRRGFRALSVAVVVLLLADPWLSRSAGFVLSTLATAGIVGWAGRWSSVLTRWLPAWLAEAACVPLSAQIATQPVVTMISGQVSVVGIVANALAGPCVGPATVLGFGAAGASVVSQTVAGVLGFAAAWATQPIIWIARSGSTLPGAVIALPTSAAVIALITACCGVTALVLPRLLRRPWLVLAAAIVLVVVMLRVPAQPGWPPAGWLVVACDVGQGDGLVLRAGPGEAVVVDTGPDPALMDRCLDQLGIRSVPVLILSHFHADHVGGLAGLLSGRRVGQVMVSPLRSPPAEAARTAQLLSRLGVPVRVGRVGETLTVGDLTWQTIGPVVAPTLDQAAADTDEESSVENDSSIVGMVTVTTGTCRVRILMPGDAEPPEQRDLLTEGVDLRADVLKVPHHGSSRQEQAFLDATQARIAITSSALHNVYGHPAPSTVRRLQALGMTVLRTDTEGGVAVRCHDGRLAAAVQTHR